MELSQRFLTLLRQQFDGFVDEPGIKQLVLYVTRAKKGENPSLEPIGFWPDPERAFPPAENDPDLRSPSSSRRWYPLQEGKILLGALRVEIIDSSNTNWPENLDRRFKATAAALVNCLYLEMDRQKLLEKLNHQKDQIGLMVHQLRNPLAALRTYAQLLLRKVGHENTHRTLVEKLLVEQSQLDKYISALDEISRPQFSFSSEGFSPLLLPPALVKSAPIKIKDILEPLIDRAKATGSLQSRSFKFDGVWPNWAKELQPSKFAVIGEIIANIIENAFKYSPLTSSIGVEFIDYGICVWDTGEQILEKDRKSIFLKGVRGEKNSEIKGKGIGLSLAKELSDDLGWELSLIIPPNNLNKKLPSKGNAFYIKLFNKKS
tara:strand:- start:467 stop:1591 length:1125 start_codon:yes stop_codon:yes gene_type:complete